jgi:hypothetical protein
VLVLYEGGGLEAYWWHYDGYVMGMTKLSRKRSVLIVVELRFVVS